MLYTLDRVTCEETFVDKFNIRRAALASSRFTLVSEWSASPPDHSPVHM